MGRGWIRASAAIAVTVVTAWAEPIAAARAGPRSASAERHAADRREERRRRWSGAVFVMQESEARLFAFPYRILSATLPTRRAYLVSAVVDRTVLPRFTIPLPLIPLHGNSLELEGQVLQHWGLEHDTELTAAAVVRSGQFGILGRTSANVAWGNGFSYALSAPNFERGPSGAIGVDTRHLQYHMNFEVEATSGAAPHLHYVLRLHHRSGIYGLISPARTGSNYLGLGLRLDFGGRS